MADFFTAEQIELLVKSRVRLGTLVYLDVEGAPKRLWNGFGDLPIGADVYEGIGGLGRIDGLGTTDQPVSQQVQLTLSGVSEEILALALSESDAVEGRFCSVSFQPFDDEFQPIGGPIEPWFGIMQKPQASRTPAGFAGSDLEEGEQMSVMLPAENFFFGRSRIPNGRYTWTDQQRRYPSDRFFAFVASLVFKAILWPDY